jgi:hypothetical protein
MQTPLEIIENIAFGLPGRHNSIECFNGFKAMAKTLPQTDAIVANSSGARKRNKDTGQLSRQV